MSERRAITGALTAPLLLLAACGGGDDSVADPPVSSATSSPTQAPHRESPEHFIRRWAEEDTRIQQTGDTEQFRAMSRDCEGCLKLADLVDHIYQAGGFIRTRGWTVRRISAESGSLYALDVFSARTTYSKSKGGVVRHLPSGLARFELHVRYMKDSWNVTSLVQVAS